VAPPAWSSAIRRTARTLARWLRFAKLLGLYRDIGEPDLLGGSRRGGLPLGCMLMATGKQLLASLAVTGSTLAGVRLAFPRTITTITRLPLYTLGHTYPLLPTRADPHAPAADQKPRHPRAPKTPLGDDEDKRSWATAPRDHRVREPSEEKAQAAIVAERRRGPSALDAARRM
jgi:hypothetical protein